MIRILTFCGLWLVILTCVQSRTTSMSPSMMPSMTSSYSMSYLYSKSQLQPCPTSMMYSTSDKMHSSWRSSMVTTDHLTSSSLISTMDSMLMPSSMMSPSSKYMTDMNTDRQYVTNSIGHTICYILPMGGSSMWMSSHSPGMTGSLSMMSSSSMLHTGSSSMMSSLSMLHTGSSSMMSSSSMLYKGSSSLTGMPSSMMSSSSMQHTGSSSMKMSSSMSMQHTESLSTISSSSMQHTGSSRMMSSSSINPTPSSSMMASSSVIGCARTVDCAGVCGGANVLDSDCSICYGPQANYTRPTQFKDCNSTCWGSATINQCGYCSGGNTNVPGTYGVDSCNGICTNSAKYVNPTDCNGNCNGTAYIDASCTGECIGGITGKHANYSRDCSNICNGTNVYDSCGFCAAAFSGATGSLYKDCAGTCYTPATISNMAANNTCGVCTGGGTSLPITSGQDACGVCGGDNSTCADCQNVPNGGKVLDACGTCGGDGTGCLAVSSATPNLVPSVTASSVELGGAGFDRSGLECYLKTNAGPEVPVTIATKTNAQKIIVSVTSSITTGDYTVFCRLAGSTSPTSNVSLTVYDSTAVSLTAISPIKFTKIDTTNTQVLTLTGTGFLDGNTYCLVAGSSPEFSVTAVVASVTSATCTLKHPQVSQQLQVSLSLNKVHKVGSPITVTVQAAAPTATAKFSNNGGMIAVVFDTRIATASFSSCSDIFNNSTLTTLGATAKCSVVSRTNIIIRGSNAALSASLVPKTDAIKQAREPQAIAMTSAISISAPDNPVSPIVTVHGPSVVGACIQDIVLDAGSSTGGGGRAMTYSWSISPNTTLTDENTPVVTLINATANTYTFTLAVTNFLSQTTTVSKIVQKNSVVLPELFVTSTADSTVLVSESFDIIANAKLIKGCADDTLTFLWSISGGIVVDNIQKTRQRLTVSANSLPAGTTLTATVVVALQSAPSATIEGTYVFSTKYAPLEARIKGASRSSVGVNSGTFTLDASNSVDPSNVGDMTFSWQCIQINNGVTSGCISPDGSSFPTSTTSTFAFNANKLLANKQYIFTVSTLSGSRSSQASVMVNALAGNPPKVQMADLKNGGFFNKDDTVSLEVLITLPSPGASVTDIAWSSVQDTGKAFVDLSVAGNLALPPRMVNIGNNHVMGMIVIQGGILERGQSYLIMVSVTDNSANVVTGSTDFNIYAGVSSCSIATISPYSAMSQVTVSVSNCVTDAQGGSLTYGLFVKTDNMGKLLRLQDSSISNTMVVPFGPKAYLGSVNEFSLTVCAKKGGCMTVTSAAVTITAVTAQQLAAKKSAVLNAVADMKKTSNPLQGCVMLGVYIDSSGSPSRRKRSVATNDLHTAMLEMIKLSLTTITKSETMVNTLLDVIGSTKYTQMSDIDILKVVEFYNETLNYLEANSYTISPKHVESALQFMKDIKTRSIVASFDDVIQRAISKAFALGDSQTYTLASEYVMKLSEEIPGATYSTAGSTPITIDFGQTLATQYASWTCGSGTCTGVQIASKHYATLKDPYSTSAADISSRASDVFDLHLVDPSIGTTLAAVTNLASPITFHTPVTNAQSDVTYVCKYWDVGTTGWSVAGLVTTAQSTNLVNCTTNHLSSFAIFSVPVHIGGGGSAYGSSSSNNLAAVIGGTIAGVIILTFIMVIVFVVKKKEQTKVHSIRILREEEIIGS